MTSWFQKKELEDKLLELDTAGAFLFFCGDWYANTDESVAYITNPCTMDLLYPGGMGDRYDLSEEMIDLIMRSTTFDTDLYNALCDAGLSIESALIASLSDGLL